MYLISKLFTAFFLPPGIFIIALLIAGLLAKRFKGLFIALAALFYLLSTKFIANMLLEPLESFRIKDSNASAVVVLAGGSNSNGLIKAYPDAFKREFYGFLLAKQKKLPLIFSGGGLGKHSEAKNAASDFKLMQNISNFNEPIYYEDKSLNTRENAIYTARVFEKIKLPKRVYLVTSAYHMKRATIYFKHAGFKVTAKPVDFRVEKSYNFYDYLPRVEFFVNSYYAIHEYIGILVALSRK